MDFLNFQNIVSGLIGGAVVAALNHFFASRRDQTNYRKKLLNEAFAALSLISFSLHMQHSELFNYRKNIEYRLSFLKKSLEELNRDESLIIFQDYQVNRSISINNEHIAQLLALVTELLPKFRDSATILQSCFISNAKYLSVIDSLTKFNEMKRITRSDDNALIEIEKFARNNFPNYLKIIDHEISFISKTLDSLKLIYKEIGYKGLKIDKPVKLG